MESSGRKSHLPPTAGVVKLGRSNLQRVADGSIGVIDLRKWQEKPRFGENLIEFYEILPNLVEISSDSLRFGQIQSKSHRIYMKYRRNLGFFFEIWKISSESRYLSVSSDFSGFGGGKPKLTRRSQFLVVKINCIRLTF